MGYFHAHLDSHCVFNPELNQFLMFGTMDTDDFSDSMINEIWGFGKHGSEHCAWKKSQMTQPAVFKEKRLEHVLCVEKLMLLFYFPKRYRTAKADVWCLDTADGEWAKAKSSFDDMDYAAQYEYIISLTDKGEIVRVSFEQGAKHRTHLRQICNAAMYEKYCIHWKTLIDGFAGAQEPEQAVLSLIQSYCTHFN